MDICGEKIVFSSKASDAQDVCCRVLKIMEENNFSSEDVFAMHLGLEEALMNAIKHGNNNDPHKTVTVNINISEKQAEISISDQGSGFDLKNIPDPREGQNIYKVGGRGIFLIKTYMDLLEFNDAGNCLRMVRKNRNKEKVS